MEKYLHIRTTDGKVIYGTLNYSSPKPKKIIILVHGLPGSVDDHPILNASRFFTSKGFATFRVGLYGWNKDARKLIDCTTKTHGKDISRVTQFLRKEFKTIFLVGHSWGMPSILFSDTSKVNAISFWDGSCDMKVAFSAYEYEGENFSPPKYVPALRGYVQDEGVTFVYGKKFVQEAMSYPFERVQRMAARSNTPIQYVAAGKGIWVKPSQSFISSLRTPTEWKMVKGAYHSFQNEGVDRVLFDQTLRWFRKFS